MGEKPSSDAEMERMRVAVLRAQAVRTAMTEIMQEQRAEIIKRAAAKLTAMGVQVKESDLEPQV